MCNSASLKTSTSGSCVYVKTSTGVNMNQLTCSDYELRRYCSFTASVSHDRQGPTYNYPERNCAVCGKGVPACCVAKPLQKCYYPYPTELLRCADSATLSNSKYCATYMCDATDFGTGTSRCCDAKPPQSCESGSRQSGSSHPRLKCADDSTLSSSRSCKTYKCQTDDYTSSDRPAPSECAVGYERAGRNSKYCYKRVMPYSPKTWAAAQAACRSDDAVRNTDLAVIGTQADADFLDSKATLNNKRGLDAWIGLNDITTEGVWLNVDGTTPTYTGWTGSEPNNYQGGEDCTHYYSAKNWNDVACDSEQASFVCGHKYGAGSDTSSKTCCDLKPRMRCDDYYMSNGEHFSLIYPCPTLSNFDSSASCATHQCAESDFSESDSGCCKVDVKAVLAAESAARAAAAAREAAAAEVVAAEAKAITDAKTAKISITIVVVVAGVAFLIFAVYVYRENEWELHRHIVIYACATLSGGGGERLLLFLLQSNTGHIHSHSHLHSHLHLHSHIHSHIHSHSNSHSQSHSHALSTHTHTHTHMHTHAPSSVPFSGW